MNQQPQPSPDEDIGAFEAMYARADGDATVIPWSHRAPHPLLVAWLDEAAEGSPFGSGQALVIASGLGDDAEELARRGWEVTAFDASPTAIAWTERRYPAPGGTVVAIAHGRDETEPATSRPWPLSRSELDVFQAHGLGESGFTDGRRRGGGGPRLFRAVYQRPVATPSGPSGGDL
jgi:hypothetical protein